MYAHPSLVLHIEQPDLVPNEIGDTSLPQERPEMLDDDLLKQLHNVLLQVSLLRRLLVLL